MKTKFENPEITISSILPRRDDRGKVKIFNGVLENFCDTTPKVKFMKNEQIDDTMLSDTKHLNVDGFFKLLANIRYSIFGKFPKAVKKKPFVNDSRYPHNPRNQTFRNNDYGDFNNEGNDQHRQSIFVH